MRSVGLVFASGWTGGDLQRLKAVSGTAREAYARWWVPGCPKAGAPPATACHGRFPAGFRPVEGPAAIAETWRAPES
jgi:hypothetical protein